MTAYPSLENAAEHYRGEWRRDVGVMGHPMLDEELKSEMGRIHRKLCQM